MGAAARGLPARRVDGTSPTVYPSWEARRPYVCPVGDGVSGHCCPRRAWVTRYLPDRDMTERVGVRCAGETTGSCLHAWLRAAIPQRLPEQAASMGEGRHVERRQSRYGSQRLADLFKTVVAMLVTALVLLAYEVATEGSSARLLLTLMVVPAAIVIALELYSLGRRFRR